MRRIYAYYVFLINRFALVKREVFGLNITAVWPNHDFKIARFAHELQVGVIEFQHILVDFKINLFAFASLQVYAFETFQLLYGADYRSREVVDIKLHHLISGAIAGICNGERRSNLAALAHGVCTKREVAILVCGIAQTITERICRSHGYVHIVLVVF